MQLMRSHLNFVFKFIFCCSTTVLALPTNMDYSLFLSSLFPLFLFHAHFASSMPKIFLCFSPTTLSYFLHYIIHYSSSFWPALTTFFILKLFFCLMSFHPPIPSHPVFHRGLNHLPLPLTQLFIVSPDARTSLHSTNTWCSQHFLPVSLIQYLFFFSWKIHLFQSVFSFLLNRRASLPNWRHYSFCCDPRKGTPGDNLDPVHFAADQYDMLCHKKTPYHEKRVGKEGYWRLYHLGEGCISNRGRKDHLCYSSSLYSTTYFYRVALIGVGYRTGQG